MTWRQAFLAQARSDNKIRRLLYRQRTQYSHQLHYLQMVAEKLAKALMASSANAPPAPTHVAIVSCLRVIKGRPEVRQALGYQQAAYFSAFIDSLLPLADSIERLAPNLAGFTQPNPEYPWQTVPNSPVVAPAEFEFADFDPRQPRMIKLVRLIEELLRILD